MNAETIFTQVLSLDSLEEAKHALAVFYIPDMSIPREEICKAVKLLEKHYKT